MQNKFLEVDPMSLIGLEGMDQIEFVIDSEDDKTDDNIDSSDNENISEDEYNVFRCVGCCEGECVVKVWKIDRCLPFFDNE
ncbi:hypothetical protein JTB14_023408 [Gonioctena quinquepunctata]|nr:hypothetical protein JTB14_023408 [Gonioctena quinquepunctata]